MRSASKKNNLVKLIASPLRNSANRITLQQREIQQENNDWRIIRNSADNKENSIQ